MKTYVLKGFRLTNNQASFEQTFVDYAELMVQDIFLRNNGFVTSIEMVSL
jgi:hypothetical protein